MIRGPASPRQTRHALLALIAMAAGAAQAQAPAPAPAVPPMARPAPSPVFAIRGFTIEGDNPIGNAEAQRVLAPYVRSDATIETLQQATAALEAALRARGFGLHRVSLPPQEVGATVKLVIVQFTIGKVAIEGNKIYDDANIRRTLPELQEGRSPNFKKLAIQTAIANENPNKQVQVGLRESEEPDKIDATINVKEQRPWTLGAAISNVGGSPSAGRDRFTVTGGHTNLFNRDHQLIAAYTTSFDKPHDVKQYGLAYKIPLYAAGGVIGAAYTRSDVVGNFGTFTSTGAGHTFGTSYTMYLPPNGGRRSYVTASLDNKLFNAAKINDIVVPGALDRRSVPISLAYSARTETDTAVWGYNAGFAFNTGWGPNDDLAAYQSEDPRITTRHWKALRGDFNYAAPFAKTWSWNTRASWQYSPDVLISGEQFGLGGYGSVRGTSIDRPLSGDKGLSGTLEINTPELATGLHLLGFVDAGWLWNNKANGTSKPASDHLASLGLGLRYARGPWAVAADWGKLVTGSRVPLAFNSSAPQSGDSRFYLTLSVRL
jgi:hemolysin activation/secretion protein